jgi:MFS family permease
VTVSYLSLFYTRFEFGRRLSLFYGQAAVGGALGGILSYIVFLRFPDIHDDHGDAGDPELDSKWQSWQVLFLLEGGLTVVIALAGYFWLPHNVETAWFLTPQEREYASTRIIQDRIAQAESAMLPSGEMEEEQDYNEESRGLLNPSRPVNTRPGNNITNDRGLTPHDIAAAFLSPRIWHILACNILSAVPVYAFQVFLPLVLAPLTGTPNPALVNLLTAPPNICGALVLYMFARYSDRHQIRLMPILFGLAVMVLGLVLVVFTPTTKAWAIPRYLALNILLSGTFIASPLTVAWISGNTPSPGKRALLLGINGWGNLAGVLSAMLFRPEYAESGYIVPFRWTMVCVAAAAMGYTLLWLAVKAENEYRRGLIREWSENDVEREKVEGRGPVEQQPKVVRMVTTALRKGGLVPWVVDWIEEATLGGREGDEKITFVYGL